MIPADIAKDFERYGGKANKRGVLTVEEAGALFARPWADGAAMAANLLSATTGMRQGEVLATTPHTDVPLGERFCFWGEAADRPRYEGRFMLDALHTELEAQGIDWRERNIVFHSWRHFYAARMADIAAADQVSRITGHKSRAVFDAYADHVTEQTVRDMGQAAAGLFARLVAGTVLARKGA